MDLSTVVMPGAQSLVTAILSDTWAQARTAVAKLWARKHPGAGTVEQTGRELDAARKQALELAGSGTEAERAARMQLFWAGYLAGLAAARPELAAAFAEIPALLGAGARTSQISMVNNSVSGIARNSVQTGDVHGNLNFGR